MVWSRGPISFFCLWKSSCLIIVCWRDCSFPIVWTWHPCQKLTSYWDFPSGTVDKNPPANAGTQVQSLVWEDSTHLGVKTHEPQPLSPRSRAHEPQPLSPGSRADQPQPLSPGSRADEPQLLSPGSRAHEPQPLSPRSRAPEPQPLSPCSRAHEPQPLSPRSRADKLQPLKSVFPRACALQQGKPLQREACVP